MVSFQKLKDDYERNWSNLSIRPPRADEARKEANRLLKGKSTYQQIETKTGVPWWFVGLCHYRESHFDFNTYLGNGQALGKVTTIVPKGRGPFNGANAFVDGAIDALRLDGFAGSTDWSIARTLFRLEGFNGFGYQSRGVNSPYLYGGSNIYGPPEARAGKFVRDHVFDAEFVDPQLGTAVILKALVNLDESIKFDGVSPMVSISPEPDEDLAQTVLWIQQSLNKLGADPQLAEDGRSGPRTREAISRFQQQSGMPETGIPDAATIAAITRRSALLATQVQQPPTDALRQIAQRLGDLERTMQSSTTGASVRPSDPVALVERLLAVIQKAAPAQGTTTSVAISPDVDQLQKAINLLTTILAASTDGKQPLGQVNGALGETIGNLLNGKKTAVGIGGALITSLLAAVTSSPSAGGLAGLFGTIASSVPGLSQFALPVFLATTAWGVLGKFEKWAQGTAPPPKPQVVSVPTVVH
jgi:lysozyme family protein/peptidoglycan hydrolase-like protein with peptidoglycan-binding domain